MYMLLTTYNIYYKIHRVFTVGTVHNETIQYSKVSYSLVICLCSFIYYTMLAFLHLPYFPTRSLFVSSFHQLHWIYIDFFKKASSKSGVGLCHNLFPPSLELIPFAFVKLHPKEFPIALAVCSDSNDSEYNQFLKKI